MGLGPAHPRKVTLIKRLGSMAKIKYTKPLIPGETTTWVTFSEYLKLKQQDYRCSTW